MDLKRVLDKGFFKAISQATPIYLPVNAMNSTMMNATSIQQQFTEVDNRVVLL
ncbi:hypothetical protein RVIR1_06270 [Candidatus Rickettsiella viridis]|uniref:Uncharacterized protein n=1 Tax=Candidatus Rickettsiella viridis TaxID=676208 RepID=A0A2Z5UUG5_9COXI|nr:hypothetical protein RVIR1_06270 [Candidatus Rickettsiella viridis]